jgi:hypothetical protein
MIVGYTRTNMANIDATAPVPTVQSLKRRDGKITVT